MDQVIDVMVTCDCQHIKHLTDKCYYDQPPRGGGYSWFEQCK